jgi:hypothetical protein
MVIATQAICKQAAQGSGLAKQENWFNVKPVFREG